MPSRSTTGTITGDAGKIYELDLYKINTGSSSLYLIPFIDNYTLLLDTGAAYTIIDEQFAREKLRINPTGIPQPVFTPGGDKLQVSPIKLKFMGVTRKCFAGPVKLWLNLFSAHTVGILGSDMLTAMDAVIDLGKLSITLSSYQGESGRIRENQGESRKIRE